MVKNSFSGRKNLNSQEFIFQPKNLKQSKINFRAEKFE